MRRDGKVIRWDAHKGFGFIRAAGPGADVFFHIRDFRSVEGKAPAIDLDVSFEEIHVGGKGPRAMAVRPCREPKQASAPAPTSRSSARVARRSAHRRQRPPPAPGAGLIWPLAMGYYAAMAWAVWNRWLPGWVLPASLAMNLLAFLAYALDKSAAASRRWRTRETTLHAWSLAGGWLGAWFAQQVLRHKSSKPSFRATYWATLAMHCAGLGVLLWFAPRA